MNIQTVQFNNNECRECYKTNKREKVAWPCCHYFGRTEAI